MNNLLATVAFIPSMLNIEVLLVVWKIYSLSINFIYFVFCFLFVVCWEIEGKSNQLKMWCFRFSSISATVVYNSKSLILFLFLFFHSYTLSISTKNQRNNLVQSNSAHLIHIQDLWEILQHVVFLPNKTFWF